MSNFDEKLQEGQEEELKVARYYANIDGYITIPIAQFGKVKEPPYVFIGSEKVTIPDIIATKGPYNNFYLEIKTKSTITAYGETGIDWNKWKEYIKLHEHGELIYVLFYSHNKKVHPHIFISIEQLLDLKPRYWDGTHDYTGERITQPLALWSIKKLEQFTFSRSKKQ